MIDKSTLLFHKPVLVEEVLHYLNPQPHSIYLDVTFGTGGHTRALLVREPLCKVIAMDWDEQSFKTYAPALQEEFGERFSFLGGNFGNAYRLLKKAGIDKVNGILADFGTSQVQIFERPGFSFLHDTKLDMRMSVGHYKTTAAYVINKLSQDALREIIWQLGQERHAKAIARAIVEERKKKSFKTTLELAELVARVVPRRKGQRIHPATKVFQALRMYVNHELDNIRSFLSAVPQLLLPTGRIVCISFHSLEDSFVKDRFKQAALDGILNVLTRKVITATQEELSNNPSSRSAKLRAAEKN